MQINRTDPEETIRYAVWEYFVNRDVDKMLDCFTEDVRWLGAADVEDVLVVGKQELMKMYLKTVRTFRVPFKLEVDILDQFAIGESQTAIITRLRIFNALDGKEIILLRVSYVLREQDGELKVCYAHSSVHYDFLRREEARIKAKNSELELNSIINANPGGIAVYQLNPASDADMLYYSDGVPALTGHTREEYDAMLEKDPYAAVYKEDREKFRAAVGKEIISGARVEIMYRRVHKDGSIIWTSLTAHAVGEVGGQYLGHAVLTGAPEQFNLQRSILDETNTSIYVVDAGTYEIYYANNAMLALLEAKKEDYTGQICYKFFFDRDAPCESCGTCTGCELNNAERPLPKLGKICSVREKFTTWMKRPAIIRYAHDITESKRAQEQFAKEQERYRLIVEHMGAVIFDWDIQSGGFYSSGNFSLYAVSEQGPAAIFAHAVSLDMVHPDDVNILKQFGADSRHKVFAEAMLRARMSDGSFRWTVLSCYNLHDEKGEHIRTIGTMHDVDDEQRIVHERYMNLRRVNTVIEDADILYWEYDILTHSAIQGETAQRAMDLPEVMENYPQSLLDRGYIPGKYAEQFRKLHDQIEEGAEHVELRHPMILSDGITRWKRMRYHTLFDKQGKPICAIGTAVDISEQVEARRQYEEIADMQELSGQKSFDYLVINITQDRIISLKAQSDEMMEYVGQSYEAFRRASLKNVVGEENKKNYLKTLNCKKLLEDYAAGIRENKLCIKYDIGNNKEIWLEINLKLTKNPLSGDVMAFSCGMDVTDQQMAREVVDAVTSYDFDLVALLNINTNTITVFKRREERLAHLLYGVPTPFEGIIKRAGDEYVFPDDKELFLKNNYIETIRSELAHKDKFEFIFRTVEADGSVRKKKTRFAYYDRQNSIVLFSRIDVTDVLAAQEKMNKELMSALKSAQQASIAKTTFLSGMSHDIRTPLNAIIGMTELAITDRDNPVQIYESLSTIKEASVHLLSLINDILEMSRIESGKMVLSQDKFSQKELIDRLLRITNPLLKKKRQTFELCNDIHSEICYGDSMRLGRVLENLVSNAIKFTPEGGSVSVACKEIPLNDRTVAMFQYTVSDTGIGIEEKQLDNIFEPFYRTGDAETAEVEGSGLGLAIVKNILDLMGGSVWVESLPGQGSSFTIEVPLRISETKTQDVGSPDELHTSLPSFLGLNVLLVEDHPVNALVAMRLLEKGGASVVTAENGKIGFEMFRDSGKDDFDAILMDIQMPVMNGYEATRAIRSCAHPRARTVPIIAMTANAFAEDVRKSLIAGMNDHIAKPVGMRRIAEALGRLDGCASN